MKQIIKAADLGNLSLYGSYTTANFGNLEDPFVVYGGLNQNRCPKGSTY